MQLYIDIYDVGSRLSMDFVFINIYTYRCINDSIDMERLFFNKSILINADDK